MNKNVKLQVDTQEGSALDYIYNDPSTADALVLSELFAKRDLAGEGLQAYLDTLPADTAPERAKLEGLLSGTESNAQIDLSSRSNQLVWAAGLGHVFQTNPPKPARSHPLWRAITDNPQVQGSLSSAARFIDLSVTNRNATMDWGMPGSWFWFSPDKNHVNIDLFNTLLTGFADDPAPGIKGMAHASGVMMHEVGHSQLTTRFTDKMQVLLQQEMNIIGFSAEDKKKLTDQEFEKFYNEKVKQLSLQDKLKLVRVRTEFGLRMNVMNAAEDNCVNQYAANYGYEMPHDFSASLNVCNVVLQGTGHILKTPPENPDANDEAANAQKSFADLNKAIALSFYSTNGLFRDDTETWKRLGIDPDAIKASDTASGQSAADHFLNTGKSDFERLLDLNVGASGMAGQQPQIRDRQLLRSIFARSIETYADRRCRIVDEIWDKYAAQYADVILDAVEQDAQNRMNQKKQENAQNDQQQDGQEQGDGQNNSQDDQQKDGQGQSASGHSSPQDQSGDDASSSQGSGSGQGSPSQNQDQSQDGNSGGNTQENATEGGEQDQSNSGGGTGQDVESENSAPSNMVDVEGVGEMELDGGDSEGKPLPSTPEEARQQQRETAEAQIDPQDAQTVRDLAREAKRQERENNDMANPANNNGQGDQGQNNSSDPSSSDPKDDLNMGSDDAQGGRDRGVDLENLARTANWQEWKLETGKLEPVIRRVADDFNYIRDRQKQKERSLSKRRETLPRGNNLRERLDMPAHMRLAVKRATGQRIEEPDLRRWKMDEVKMTPTSVELWILTDGSQSMTWDRRGRPIDAAVQSMAILYEAGRRADFDVFAGMWGDEKLRLLAQPGERDQNIGKNFQAAKNGIDSGTQLSPSFQQAIQRSAKQETDMDGKVKRFAGMTHFLILSDGELNHDDIDPFVKMVTKLFKHGPAVSVDIAVLGQDTGSEMESVVSQVKRENPAAVIDLIRAVDAKDIPVLLAQKIKRRFERAPQDLRAVPDTEKREAFTRVDRAIMSANLG